MLSIANVEEIAREVAGSQVPQGLERVFAELAADSEGKDALRITLVLTGRAAEGFTGHQAVDLLTGIQRKLEEAGEERFPIIEYATEEELETETENEA